MRSEPKFNELTIVLSGKHCMQGLTGRSINGPRLGNISSNLDLEFSYLFTVPKIDLGRKVMDR
ncbi:MAG TPA: hypothetical protein PKA76_13505, partial [Pirellulaceae bacterium]|nr:hypothetical protein [Pirellulaceae bacterium]HMP70365.1 hypothetical protein [Pirellulaceae bacterium]